MTPDLAQAKQYLRTIDPDAKNFTFQCFDDDRQRQDKTLTCILKCNGYDKDLRALYEQGAGKWVHINETNGEERKKEHIVRIRAVWQEDDDGYEGEFPLEPSLVVESSEGRFHRYWLVADEWPADEQGKADFDGVMRRMVQNYGSDN